LRATPSKRIAFSDREASPPPPSPPTSYRLDALSASAASATESTEEERLRRAEELRRDAIRTLGRKARSVSPLDMPAPPSPPSPPTQAAAGGGEGVAERRRADSEARPRFKVVVAGAAVRSQPEAGSTVVRELEQWGVVEGVGALREGFDGWTCVTGPDGGVEVRTRPTASPGRARAPDV
jgi:hypothetical protein